MGQTKILIRKQVIRWEEKRVDGQIGHMGSVPHLVTWAQPWAWLNSGEWTGALGKLVRQRLSCYKRVDGCSSLLCWVRLKGVRQDCDYCQLNAEEYCSLTWGVFSEAITGCCKEDNIGMCGLECMQSWVQRPTSTADYKIYRQQCWDRSCNLCLDDGHHLSV